MRLVSLPVLRELSVDSSDTLTVRQKGNLIRTQLSESILAMDGFYEFQGQPIEAATLRRCLRLLLMFEGSGQSAENRRGRVLHILKLNYSLGQFRRPDSPERELLRLLAVKVVSGRRQIAS
jgi:hypothetical protein